MNKVEMAIVVIITFLLLVGMLFGIRYLATPSMPEAIGPEYLEFLKNR